MMGGKRIRFGLVAMAVSVVALGGAIMGAGTVFADDECANGVKTAILGENHCFTDTSGSGEASGGGMVIKLLTDIVDILTVGVGILGVIGITVVGLQYLTAGGSEEKTRTAKRRMFEIIIGLITYALIYAILKWLALASTSGAT